MNDEDYNVNKTSFSYNANLYNPNQFSQFLNDNNLKWIPNIPAGMTALPENAS